MERLLATRGRSIVPVGEYGFTNQAGTDTFVVQIDVADIFHQYVAPIISQVQKLTGHFQPVINLLNTPVPLLSLVNSDYTFAKAISLFGYGDLVGFANTIDSINRVDVSSAFGAQITVETFRVSATTISVVGSNRNCVLPVPIWIEFSTKHLRAARHWPALADAGLRLAKLHCRKEPLMPRPNISRASLFMESLEDRCLMANQFESVLQPASDVAPASSVGLMSPLDILIAEDVLAAPPPAPAAPLAAAPLMRLSIQGLTLKNQDIAIESYGWGAQQLGGEGSGGAGTGKVTFSDFSFVMPTSSMSPKLAEAAAGGRHFTRALLTLAVDGKPTQVYARWTLEDVTVSSVQIQDTDPTGGALLRDAVTLRFAKIIQEFAPVEAGGKVGPFVKSEWDSRSDTGSSASFSAFQATDATPAIGLQIKGSSGTRGEIPIDSFSWGAAQPGGAGKVNMQDFHFTMKASTASPAFLWAAASGVHIQEAVVLVRNARGEVYQRWTLQDVVVRTYQTADESASPSTPAVETVSLSFSKLTDEYRATEKNGKPGPRVEAEWDQKRQIGTSASFGAFEAVDTSPAIGVKVFGAAGDTRGEIPVQALHWGEFQASIDGEGGAGAGKVQMSDFQLTMSASAASPAFFWHNASGAHLPRVVISLRNAADVVFQRWTLENVTVRSYQTADASADAAAGDEKVALAFERIRHEFRAIDPSGKPGAWVKAEWDLARSVGSGASFREFKAVDQAPAMGLQVVDGGGRSQELPIASMTWGEFNSSGTSGGGLGAGKVAMQDMQVTLRASAASPAFFAAAASGRHLMQVVLNVRDAKDQIVSRWILENVTVSGYDTADMGVADDGPAMEQISLRFQRIRHEYRTLEKDGKPGPLIKAEWDQGTQTGGGSTFNAFKAELATPPMMGLRIEGGSDRTDGEISIDRFQWGGAGESTTDTGGGGVGKFNVQDFLITMKANAASPAFMLAGANGRHLQKATLSVRDATGRVYERWILEDVTVSAFQTSDESVPADELAAQTVALTFSRITREYIPIDANGKAGATIKMTWDVRKNEGNAPSFSAYKTESAVPPKVGLEIKGVNGTTGEIPIDAFGWGASMASAMSSGGGAGKAVFNDLHFQMKTNAASPAFSGHAATGKYLERAVLNVRDDAGKVVQRWTLEDVQVRSFQTGDAKPDQSVLLTESVALRYARIKLEQYNYDAFGKALPPTVFAWDVKLSTRV